MDSLLLLDDSCSEEILLMNLTYSDREYKKDFDVNSFEESEFVSLFRFGRVELDTLKNSLAIPDKFVCRNGSAIPGSEALCILLRRLVYPNRLYDIGKVFNRPNVELSYVINDLCDFIYQGYGYLLTDLRRQWLSAEHLRSYAAVIHEAGAPLDNCWGFIDGSVRPICRPTEHQRMVFNGHKRVHSLKFQSVVTPNGLIANLFGPIEGKRHDSGMLKESGLLAQLRRCMTMPDGTIYSLYGDPAYPTSAYLLSPFKGPNIGGNEQLFNEQMSSVRIAVETLFGDIVRYFAFIDFAKNQKLYLQPVGKYYAVAAFLVNCLTCLNGNRVSEMFGLTPPTLQEYVAG